MTVIVEAKHLKKNYGNFTAVKDISFQIEEGEIFGLLGPNGAGKSTTIKMLVTLLRPSGGSARINGFDVEKDSKKVRNSVGIIFQDPSLDERLTAQENLFFHSRLYHIPGNQIQGRIDQALELVDLTDRRNDMVMNFSGGMKRRLEIARGIIHTPRVLFLDEPTIGLDPQTRTNIWNYLSKLKKTEKISMLLTTHYIEEAEICDRIAIIDHGEIVALDTPENLKKNLKKDVVTISTGDNKAIAASIKKDFNIKAEKGNGVLHLKVENGKMFIPLLFEKYPGRIVSVDIQKPSLEDVFISLTGRNIRKEDASATDKLRNIVKRRGRK